jgi:hypothetical protein
MSTVIKVYLTCRGIGRVAPGLGDQPVTIS